MKNRVFAVAVLAMVPCFAQEAAPSVAVVSQKEAEAAAAAQPAPRQRRLPRVTPEMIEARQAREAERAGIPLERWKAMDRDERRDARDAKMAEVPYEEWRTFDKSVRREKLKAAFEKRRDARDAKMAAEKGVSVEEFRAERAKRRAEGIARREELRKRHAEAQALRKAAEKKDKEEKETAK